MPINPKLSRLSSNVQIADPETGYPTPMFQRLIQQLLEEKASTEEQVELTAGIDIIAGTGLDGGGPLDGSGDVTLTMENTAVTPDTYGDSTHYPIVTVDQQGRITSASEQSISVSSTALIPTTGVAGRYYPPDTQGFAAGTFSTTANGIYALPFTKDMNIDALAIEVTTLVAASNVRFALYQGDGPNNFPKTLIAQSSPVATASTGIKVGTLGLSHPVTDIVWLCALFSHAPIIRGGEQREEAADFFGSTVINVVQGSYSPRLFGAFTYGSFPANLVTAGVSFTAGSSNIIVVARAA